MSFMKVCEAEGYQVRHTILTTAAGGSPRKLAVHFRELMRRVEQKYNYESMAHAKVRTEEGNGTLHVMLAWKGRRVFWIDQKWLSEEWERIHGARVVYIKAINGKAHAKSVARYVATQYIAKQTGKTYFSANRQFFGFPLEKAWKAFRVSAGRHLGKSGIAAWGMFLAGKIVELSTGIVWDIAQVRGDPTFIGRILQGGC
jgi:hypothetical protein